MIWYVYSLLAALFLAAAVLLEKKNLKTVHALEFSTETSFYGLIFALFLLPWVKWNFDYSIYLLIIAQGILAVFGFLLFNKSLRHTDLSEVSPLINLDTIATLFFALLLLGELPSKMQLVGIAFLILGAYFLELKPKDSPLDPLRAFTQRRHLIMLFGAIVMYGLNRVLVKMILFEVSAVSLIFFSYCIYFLGYLIIDWISFRQNVTGLKSLLQKHGIGLLWTSLAVFAHRLFMSFSLATGAASLVTAISRTSTFFTALAGGKLFSENNLRQKAVAAVVILLGVLLIIL